MSEGVLPRDSILPHQVGVAGDSVIGGDAEDIVALAVLGRVAENVAA